MRASGGKVALVRDADDAVACADREQNLRRARQQADDALRRVTALTCFRTCRRRTVPAMPPATPVCTLHVRLFAAEIRRERVREIRQRERLQPDFARAGQARDEDAVAAEEHVA